MAVKLIPLDSETITAKSMEREVEVGRGRGRGRGGEREREGEGGEENLESYGRRGGSKTCFIG